MRKKTVKGLEQLEVIESNHDDAILSSKLELESEKKGHKVSRIDALIAAITINRKGKLFTFNKKHFQVFDDLLLF